MNCVCDGLGKVVSSLRLIDETPHNISYLLPLEKEAVIVNVEKSTTEITKEVVFFLGEEDAHQFYTER